MFDIIRYEIKTIYRKSHTILTPLLFFIMVVTLFPLAVGPDTLLLQKISPAIIWVAALLAILLSIGNLFRADWDEGTLDLMLASPHPLTLLVICRILSHWLTHCLPLVLIGPLLGFLLHLPPHEEWVLLVSLLLGTPVLTLLGAIGAALVVGIRHHGLLLPVLIMPLYVPVLIFGATGLTAAATGQPVAGYFAILAALLLSSLAFAPLLTGIALRIGANQ